VSKERVCERREKVRVKKREREKGKRSVSGKKKGRKKRVKWEERG
jgi:hypothetical protein